MKADQVTEEQRREAVEFAIDVTDRRRTHCEVADMLLARDARIRAEARREALEEAAERFRVKADDAHKRSNGLAPRIPKVSPEDRVSLLTLMRSARSQEEHYLAAADEIRALAAPAEPAEGERGAMCEHALRVRDLRKALEGVPDDMQVLVAAVHNEGDDYELGGLVSAAVEYRCSDTPAFYITGDDEVPPVDEDDIGGGAAGGAKKGGG